MSQNTLSITPFEGDLASNPDLVKLELNDSQKEYARYLLSQVPEITKTEIMAHAYIVKYPKGVPHSLMKYSNGGYGSPIISKSGIVDHAAFFPIDKILARSLGIIAIITSQYYLTKINSKMQMMNEKIDRISTFLYGDKRAELVAEISFVQSAHKNYSSIMEHPEQRIATIGNIQSAQKIAIKDIEFYMDVLNNKSQDVPKSYGDFESIARDAIQIKESLDMSVQLLASSVILEVFLSDNTDESFLKERKDSLTDYIDKANTKTREYMSALKATNNSYKSKGLKKNNVEPLNNELINIIDQLYYGHKSPLHSAIEKALSYKDTETLYVSESGSVYLQAN